MPRGRKKAVETIDINSRIAAAEKEIAELNEAIKAKKKELKALLKEQEKELKAQAEAKAREDQETLQKAFAESGKSIEEILAFLKKRG